jgi:hypothetical protein
MGFPKANAAINKKRVIVTFWGLLLLAWLPQELNGLIFPQQKYQMYSFLQALHPDDCYFLIFINKCLFCVCFENQVYVFFDCDFTIFISSAKFFSI